MATPDTPLSTTSAMSSTQEPARNARSQSVSSPAQTTSRPPGRPSSVAFPNRLLHDLAQPAGNITDSKVMLDAASNWARRSISSSTRISRASSIVSTRTRASIHTMTDDLPEAFDVQIDNENVFRFGLDGRIKRLARTGSGTIDAIDVISRDSHIPSSDPDRFPIFMRRSTDLSLIHPTSDPLQRKQVTEHTLGPLETRQDSAGVSRNPSFTPGKENLSVVRRRTSSGTILLAESPPTAASDYKKLQRKGGVKLKVVTRNSNGQIVTRNSPLTPVSGTSSQASAAQDPRSAGSGAGDRPSSPSYFGRNATGTFPPNVSQNLGVPQEYHSPLLGAGPGPRPTQDDKDQKAGSPLPESSSSITSGDRKTDAGHNDSIPLITPTGPASLEEATIGAVAPPVMDTENDVSIHYSRLVRTIDASHRAELREKEQEILDGRKTVAALAQQLLDLKAEHLRLRNQAKRVSASIEPQPIGRTKTIDAQSFSFPPLTLRHVKTLKHAIRRRAEKIRKAIDEELVMSPRGSITSLNPQAGQPQRPTPSVLQKDRQGISLQQHSEPILIPQEQGFIGPRPVSNEITGPQERGGDQIDVALPSSQLPPHLQRGNQRSVTVPGRIEHHKPEVTFEELLRSIEAAEEAARLAKLEVQRLQNHSEIIQESLTFWTDRCEQLENQKSRADKSAEASVTGAVEQATRDADLKWQTRWEERNEQLTQRMERIEKDGQRRLEKAIAERDKWAAEWGNKISELSVKLDFKEEEVAKLKRRLGGRESGSARSSRVELA